jgi:prevent-host-death family protein
LTIIIIYITIIAIMPTPIQRDTGATAITAMDLRREPGKWLDMVDYRNQSFVIQRAGKPKAVIIPFREYEQVRRVRREARERFWAMAQELRAAFKDADPKEVERETAKAIAEVRAIKKFS